MLKRLLKSKLFKSIASALGTAGLMYVLLPLELAAIKFIILLAHEAAHYIMAIRAGAKPAWPVFIPLGIFVIGITKIRGVSLKDVASIAMAGPIVGIVLSIIALIIGIVFHNPLIILGAIWTLLTEAAGLVMGADAKARRDAKVRLLGDI